MRRILHGGALGRKVELVIDKREQLVHRRIRRARAELVERFEKHRAFFVCLGGLFQRRVEVSLAVTKAYPGQLVGREAENA